MWVIVLDLSIVLSIQNFSLYIFQLLLKLTLMSKFLFKVEKSACNLHHDETDSSNFKVILIVIEIRM